MICEDDEVSIDYNSSSMTTKVFPGSRFFYFLDLIQLIDD